MFDTAERTGTDEGCATIAAAVDALAADDPAALGAGEQIARLRQVSRLVDRLRAEQVRLLAAADRSGALEEDGSATAAAWLRHHTSMTATEASTHAKVARRLRELPGIADALAAGDVGMAHAAAIDRLARDVGVDQVAAVQEELVEAAVRLRDVREFQRLCLGWRHAMRPELLDDDDDRAYAGRRLTFASTLDGKFHLSGAFDAEGGATIAAAIDAFMTADPPDTPTELRRSPAQRRADALVEVARRSLSVAPDVAGVRPQVVTRVSIDPETGQPGPQPAEMDWVGPVGPATLERQLSDCSLVRHIVRGDSQPLDIGVATRVWPAGVRRAITDRDRGCRFFTCDRPSQWCDIDHIDPVSEGGPTAVTNGILLCRHHHRAKRRAGWWPALEPDGTVTWMHADGRTGSDPPPARLDNEIVRLRDAAARAVTCAGETAVIYDATGPSGAQCAGETAAIYDVADPSGPSRAGRIHTSRHDAYAVRRDRGDREGECLALARLAVGAVAERVAPLGLLFFYAHNVAQDARDSALAARQSDT